MLPPVYDRWQKSYGKDYSELVLPRLLLTLHSYGITPSTMLDVGCGTGTMALMMARRGWRVWGVDASAGMLHEAWRKSMHKRSRISYLRQEMTRIRLPVRVALAVSLFDTLNHLTRPRDLLAAFRCIRAALLPGGYLIFDLNDELCFKTLWTQTQTVDHRDFTLILNNSYDARRKMAASRVTMFFREGDRFRREHETVRERCYPDSEVSGLLQKAGFAIRESTPFNFSSLPHIGRLKTWWVAQAAPS